MRRHQQYQSWSSSSNNKKPSSNERKSTGNTWEEQDDLFFGGSSSTTPSTNVNTNNNNNSSMRMGTGMGMARSYAGICPPCSPPAAASTASQRSTRRADKDDDGDDDGGGKRNFNWSSKIASSRNRIASLADTASSRISDRINDLQQSQQQQSQRHTTTTNTGSSGGGGSTSKGSKGTRAFSSLSPTVASLPPVPPAAPAQARSIRPTSNPNPPSQRRRNISNMVQTALISQIPLQCKVCNSIPLMYQCHPFFGPKERICSTHSREEIIKCVSCFRFEPKNHKFARIGISDAKVCPSCARTALLDNASATTLYWEILRFFSQVHMLDLFEGKMESIPIQLVDEPTLNSKSSSIDCNPNAQKRGLCVWSESHYGMNLPNLSNLPNWMGGIAGAGGAGRSRSSRTRSAPRGTGDVPTNRSVGIRHVTVQSIYCLKGLPRSLMGSILAHEAMHAWFGLNPLRRDGVVGEESHGEVRRIPLVVEEGLCQLASHLYLNHVMDLESVGTSVSGGTGGGGGGGPSDDKLREYFRWSIETDSSPVYGDGFRMAAMAYNEICDNGGSLMDLLQYAMMHKALPC